MARHDTKNLYKVLRSTAFGSVPEGEYDIAQIYSLVKAKHEQFCDDSFLCADNCGSASRQPEWQHAVRRALQAEKAAANRISAGTKKRHWRFK